MKRKPKPQVSILFRRDVPTEQFFAWIEVDENKGEGPARIAESEGCESLSEALRGLADRIDNIGGKEIGELLQIWMASCARA